MKYGLTCRGCIPCCCSGYDRRRVVKKSIDGSSRNARRAGVEAYYLLKESERARQSIMYSNT